MVNVMNLNWIKQTGFPWMAFSWFFLDLVDAARVYVTFPFWVIRKIRSSVFWGMSPFSWKGRNGGNGGKGAFLQKGKGGIKFACSSISSGSGSVPVPAFRASQKKVFRVIPPNQAWTLNGECSETTGISSLLRKWPSWESCQHWRFLKKEKSPKKRNCGNCGSCVSCGVL